MGLWISVEVCVCLRCFVVGKSLSQILILQATNQFWHSGKCLWEVWGLLSSPSGKSYLRIPYWVTKNYFPHLHSFGQHWCYMKSVKSKPNTRLTKCDSEENTLNTFETMQCSISSKLLLDNKIMKRGRRFSQWKMTF